MAIGWIRSIIEMQEKSHAFGGDFFYIEMQTCSTNY